MSILQKQNFEGMDKDTALVYVPQGSYRDALNVHVGSSQNGNIGIVENVPGNTLVTNSSLPSGTNKVIGSIEDRQDNKIFYLLYNSNSNHGIYSYNLSTGAIALLMQSSLFNFNPSYPVTGIGYVNGILTWTDNYNPPRLVDLNHISSYNSPYTEEMISLIKKNPPYPPTVTRKYDASYASNFISKNSFQFATRIIYLDNSKSKLSPYSKLSTTGLTISSKTVTIPGGQASNLIQVTNPDSNNYIEINLNISELLAGNYISMVKKIEVLVREGNTNTFYILTTLLPAQFTSSQIVNFYNDLNLIAVDQSEISEDFDSVPVKSAALAVAKNRIFLGGNTEGYDPPTGILQSVNPSYSPIYQTVFPTSFVNNSIFNSRLFKDRGTFNVGLVWYDKFGRHTGVQDSKKVVVNANPQNTFRNVCTGLTATLSGTPPSWAYYYGIVRSKNLHQDFFLQLHSFRIFYIKGFDGSGNPQYDAYTANANTFYIYTHIHYETGASIAYNFTQGDRIFVMYSQGGVNKTADLPILAVTSYDEIAGGATFSGNKIIVDFFDFGDGINFSEVYSPTVQDGLFYEVGEIYPVTNPGQSNRSLSQISINITQGDIYFNLRSLGIVSGRAVGTNFPAECMGLFLYNYDISSSDIGRDNLVIDDEKALIKDTNVRFSNVWIQGSNINGLSTFGGLNEKVLPVEFGSIYKLQIASNTESNSNVLLSIHSKDIASLYIEEVVFSDVAGQTTVAIADSVIGAVRALRGGYGTINPESVVTYNSVVYGFDANKGVVWRYAEDGLNPISDIFMKNYFYNKSRTLLTIAGFKAYGGYDPYYNEYILSFDSGNGAVSETVAFNEKINRWTSFYSFVPEAYQRITTYLVSFKNGNLYLHGTNSTYNNFYGTQYTSRITPICNIEPSKEKVLLNVGTESQDVWVAINITTPEGQQTSNIAGDYYHLANAWSANVLRDTNTPAALLKPGQLAILSGDRMRSSVFSVQLENTMTVLSTLRFANFKVIGSERSNK